MIARMHLDSYDRRLLDALQRDCLIDRNALAEAVGLSVSQVARRRQALEETGVIRGYRAEINEKSVGLSILVLVSVRLKTHAPEGSSRFHALLQTLPEVQEAYMVTGESDYELKVRVADLDALSLFVNERLLPHPSVERVRSDIVLKTLKDSRVLPL